MNNEQDQLTIFDMLEEQDKNDDIQTIIYELNDRIQIRQVRESEDIPSEDYYYLKDFSGKKGKIISKDVNSNGTFYYKVHFNNGMFGYFYAGDFIGI